jgi:hypothetical protein
MHARRPHEKRLRLKSLLSFKLIFVVFASIAISGCAQTVAGTAEQVCRDWRQIGVRKADQITDDTAKEIIGNNDARAAWCTPRKA